MKKFFPKQWFVYTSIALCCMGFVVQAARADVPGQSQKSPETFAGYTQALMQAPDVSPYGVVNGEDVIPAMVGYGLLTKAPISADAPFQPPSTLANNDMPNINAATSTQFLLGTMLQSNPSENEIKGYSDGIADIFKKMDSAALPPISSSSSYNSVANVGNPNSLTATINQVYANPYDSSSLFHYVPSAGATNPAQIYIALVDGSLTPVPLPSTVSDDFSMQLRRIAATQTAGINALQEIFDRSKPVLTDNEADSMKNTLKSLGDNSITAAPTSPRDFEKMMATHRMDPNNGWFAHVEQATPVELQRQALYLQAEMLYEMYQVHKEEEQNKMLLAVSLLAQNYQNRGVLNLQSKMSPAAIKAMTASAKS